MLIFYNFCLSSCLQKAKGGKFEMSNSLIFKTVYISRKKHFDKQKLLYILNENTIWPSGVIVRESDSHEKNTM